MAADINEVNEVYDRISRRIGLTDKEYIVDPTSSFLRSVQCACLPGITSYLRLYRAILTAVKTCFNAIVQTGEGSAGVCRAVLSVYVCDLVWDLLRCFTEKYSAGFDRSRSDSLGNLFGALTSAGNGVSNSIQNRYGGTTLYKSLFVEKRLVHAVCLWAFTGTWDLDVTGMLEGEGLPVPIKSQGVLYPCQRRFISFNPVTRPVPGIATWTYHFGVGLVAGAELRWNLELECSTTPECKSSEGFDKGLCDCQQGTPQKTIIQGGYLKSGDVLSEQNQGDIFFTTTMPYRYNKARLWWEYKDNKDQTIRDEITCDVSQEGPAPPSLCGFDIATLSYRCGFNTGTENWARIIGRPRAYGEPFRLGDSLGFDVEVSQRIPGEGCEGIENCQYQKYLVVSVVNQNGVPILDNYDAPYALEHNGRETATVLRNGVPISREDFSRTPSTTSTSTSCVVHGNALGIKLVTLGCESTLKVYKEQNNVLMYVTGTYGSDVQGGIPKFNPTGAPEACTGDATGLTFRCGTHARFTLYQSVDKITIGSASEIEASASARTDTQTSNIACDSNYPVQWKATFTIYEANTQAETGYEASRQQVAQYLGTPQQFEYTYNAVCGDRIMLGGIPGSTTGGTSTTAGTGDTQAPIIRAANIYEGAIGTTPLTPQPDNANSYKLVKGKGYVMQVQAADLGDVTRSIQPSGIKSVTLKINNANPLQGTPKVASSQTDTTFEFSLAGISGTSGVHSLLVEASDIAGNKAQKLLEVQVT